MLRNWKQNVVAAALLACAPFAMGFSLLGPGGAEGVTAKEWQLPDQNDGWDIGYGRAGDIGAPLNYREFYRWNVPVITYGFDSSFIEYFGPEGVRAVDAAMRILNEVPDTRNMSEDLSEFPLNSLYLNHEAAQLGLYDIKSWVLSLMMEQIGLADPIRWNFAIRQRINVPPDDDGIYTITRFNFDPITITPSSYVNGTLWTYFIEEFKVAQISDAREVLPAAQANEVINYPVAATSQTPLTAGFFFTSLTRDDIGGIRYLLRRDNIVAETLLPDVAASAGTFSPYLGTNTLTNAIGGGTGTNGSAGLRGGIGKIRFRKVIAYQQPFKSVSYRYTDRFITTNGITLKQSVSRTIAAPDITFAADDISPAMITRTGTGNWINNEALNGLTPRGGPGVISGPVVFTFNNSPRLLQNITPFFVTEPQITDPVARANGLIGPLWASFDGTTNAPVIFPVGYPGGRPPITIDQVRNLAEGNQP